MSTTDAWHRNVLPDGWTDAAQSLTASRTTEGFYLAGGTGLALALGHRRSIDLDLFCQTSFQPAPIRDVLRHSPGFRLVQMAPDTLHVEINGVQVSFLHYPYPRLYETRTFEALDIADALDIGCMKLDALANRGSRRDFVDLFFLAREYGLRRLLDLCDSKFTTATPNRVHLSKALTYFTDAELEPMPNMIIDVDWDTIRQFFESDVLKLF